MSTAPTFLSNLQDALDKSSKKQTQVKVDKADLEKLLKYQSLLELTCNDFFSQDLARRELIPQLAKALIDLQNKRVFGVIPALGVQDLMPLGRLITEFTLMETDTKVN
jgi:hypothetical protein